MSRRLPRPLRPLAAATTVACLVLAPTACSQAEDAARSAASSAATQASDQVKERARAEAIKQACGLTTGSGPLSDGKVSANERAAVAAAAGLAKQAGVSSDYTDPLQTIASSGQADAATRKAVEELKSACAKAQ